MGDRGRGSDFLLGAILGGLIGAGTFWFLTSTKTGEKIKKQMQKKSEEALNNLSEIVEDLEEKGEEFKEQAAEVEKELEEKAQSLKRKFFTQNGKPLS